MQAEIWHRVKETQYEVSNHGNVRSGESKVGQWANSLGYMLVRLSGPRRIARVHRLVAEAFIPNIFDKPFVNHIDCNRANNNASNLEWCTQRENLQHSSNLGRMQRNYWIGRRSPNADLSDEQVCEIRRIYSEGNNSWASLARLFKVSKRCIGRILKQETYRDVQL